MWIDTCKAFALSTSYPGKYNRVRSCEFGRRGLVHSHIHVSHIGHTHVLHTYYTRITHASHTYYTCVIHTSYICHTHIRHASCILQTYAIYPFSKCMPRVREHVLERATFIVAIVQWIAVLVWAISFSKFFPSVILSLSVDSKDLALMRYLITKFQCRGSVYESLLRSSCNYARYYCMRSLIC